MEQEILEFRLRVESYFGGRPRRGARYSVGLRAQAVELALAQMARGERLGAVASALGIGVGTLQRWLEATGDSAGRLREVEVVETGERPVQDRDGRGGLALATASGHRVEGLSLAEVAQLLGALG